jgi:PSP1 C-terminal conserved region
MGECDYLVGYGMAGEFGRFRAAAPLPCLRGDRVVIRTHRGLEIGHILREASPGHARFLPNTTVGQLVRPYGASDARAESALRERGTAICKRAGELAEQMGLPLEVLDVEILLDGEHVVLHHLCGSTCDARPFVSTLSREYSLHVWLDDLANAAPAAPEEESAECGSGCGSCGTDGGCGNCGSGCGSCSSEHAAPANFAELRAQMEQRRTSLL